jgi:Ser/Thr protein kinase RdoA (MazF antagonist)
MSLFGAETKFFYELTPEKILEAVETTGLRCTGRCLTLNSMENRVYEVEIELENPTEVKSPSEHFRVVKFYRPGRWTKEQILDEHQFLLDLKAQDIPVVAPLVFPHGSTLNLLPDMQIYFAAFPKMGGRITDELDDEQLLRMGRLLARLHNIGATKKAEHRLSMTPQTYGRDNLKFLLDINVIPSTIKDKFTDCINRICDLSESVFKGQNLQRIHGDCHLGNILWGSSGPFLVDFDDMVMGPTIQDLWLIIPGRDDYAKQKLTSLIEGYEMMRGFDWSSLKLIEPLRALRMIHFTSWIAKRWEDPAFKRNFSNFGEERYWQTLLYDLLEQCEVIQSELLK